MDYKKLLKEQNLSLTSVRMAVLEALIEHPHADANTTYEIVKRSQPKATLQAVYNNLNALSEAGIIREIKPKGTASLYETRVGDNHHHVVCRSCGHVADAHCAGYAPCLTPTEDHGFKIDEAEVIFWGICPACQKTENS